MFIISGRGIPRGGRQIRKLFHDEMGQIRASLEYIPEMNVDCVFPLTLQKCKS